MKVIPRGEALGELIGKCVSKKLDSGRVKNKAEIARALGVTGTGVSQWIKTGRVADEKLPEITRYFSDVSEPADWGLEAWPDWPESGRIKRPFEYKRAQNILDSESWQSADFKSQLEEFTYRFLANTKPQAPEEELLELFNNADAETKLKIIRVVRILAK